MFSRNKLKFKVKNVIKVEFRKGGRGYQVSVTLDQGRKYCIKVENIIKVEIVGKVLNIIKVTQCVSFRAKSN